jgi:small subunit ribosomal protein S3
LTKKRKVSSLGQKTHPIGFRLGIVKDWQGKWFAQKQSDYRALVLDDLVIRQTIMSRYPDAGISSIEIERNSSDVIITIHTARPGIVIGRGGQRVEELRKVLERRTKRRARLNVQEIRQGELDAFLVARSVADQLERRINFRRAMRQAITRTMQAGAEGIKIICAGRLGGSDIARREKAMEGRVPLHTLRADIDYGLAEAATDFGRIGVKAWIFKGIIIRPPAKEQEEIEDIPTIEVTLRAGEEEEEETAPDATTEESEIPQST